MNHKHIQNIDQYRNCGSSCLVHFASASTTPIRKILGPNFLARRKPARSANRCAVQAHFPTVPTVLRSSGWL